MIPSDAVGAPKICGTPPAARTPSHPLRARRSRWALHGVMSLNSEATPIIGRSKSSSRKPTPRSMARFGARPTPPVVVRLCRVASPGMDGSFVGGWCAVTLGARPGGCKPGSRQSAEAVGELIAVLGDDRHVAEL